MRRVFDAKKAGHAGTLDPLAFGVLPIALGEATKTVPFVMDARKTYRFTITWGSQTNTDDTEGEAIATSDKRPSEDEVADCIPHFLGDIEQTPPQFSAVKINGQAAYKSARKGDEVEIKPRSVYVYRMDLVAHDGASSTLEAEVSKGTYVRAFARDMGKMLGCYGHISCLQRVNVGGLNFEHAVNKEKLDSCLEMGQSPHTFLLPVDVVLDDIPAYAATIKEVNQIKAGMKLTRVHLKEGHMRVVDPNGQIASIVSVDARGDLNVVRNFNLAD